MILYILNGIFPENSGFGRRCLREIEALAGSYEVVVLCRKNQENSESKMKLPKNVRLEYFTAESAVVHRPENYSGNGLYEVKRNLDLMLSLTAKIAKLIWRNRKHVEVYAVTSPLTVPLIALFWAKILRVPAKLVSFHDLEPEMAMHLKKIDDKHWITKIELLLEKIVCKNYQKILVTTEGQAQHLIERNSLPTEKVLSIVNSTDITSLPPANKRSLRTDFAKTDFIVVYMSTISFDYTVTGLIAFLEALARAKKKMPNIKVAVLGDGEGLRLVRECVQKNQLEDVVKLYGHVDQPAALLASADAGIIPWQKDIMTETMLPTKLFEYLSLKVPVIAPDFGEFSQILTQQENAVLYSSESELLEALVFLQKNPQQRVKIGEKGGALYTAHYQPKELNKKLLSFYQQL